MGKRMGFNRRFWQVLGGSVVVFAMGIVPVWAEELQNWSFNTATNELMFSLSDTVLPEFFLLAEPPRLVLDIPDTQMGDIEPEQLYSGAVRNIRIAQHTAEQVRVVIELDPDIELSPEQADIQFDDKDGQRYWRFRPLLVSSAVAAASNTFNASNSTSNNNDETLLPGLQSGVSQSAANLEIPVRSAGTALPIDPYAPDTSSQVVSVPPLEDLPDEDLPLEDLPDEDLLDSHKVAVTREIAAVPELPPMIVPQLEDIDVDNTVNSADALTQEVPEARRLPDLGREQPVQVELAAQSSGLPTQAEPLVQSEPSTQEDSLTQAEPSTQAEPPGQSEALPPEQSELSTKLAAQPERQENLESAALNVDRSVDRVDLLEDNSPPEVTNHGGSIPQAPTTTALAPVTHAAPDPQAARETPDGTALQMVQQPAAERTIVQIEAPMPLTFGQPLPRVSR